MSRGLALYLIFPWGESAAECCNR